MPIILTFSICSILVLSPQDIDPLAGILAVLLVRDAEHQAQCPLIPAAEGSKEGDMLDISMHKDERRPKLRKKGLKPHREIEE